MTYKSIIEKARKSGVANERVMNKSVERVDELLEKIREDNPDAYWRFVRDTYTDIYGYHYNEQFADYDMSFVYYIKDGVKHSGAHWDMNDVINSLRGKQFPDKTTDYDKYVALNVMYSDLCNNYPEEQIIDIAYIFFFRDTDAPDGKVWRYMEAMTNE